MQICIFSQGPKGLEMVGPTSEAPPGDDSLQRLGCFAVGGLGSWMMDGTRTPFFSIRGEGRLWKNPRHPVSENPVNLDDDTIENDTLDEWRDEIRGRSFMICLQSRIPTKTHVYEPINATMCFFGVETAHRMVFLILPASQWGYLNSGLHIGRLWSMRSLTGFMADAPKPWTNWILTRLGPCQMVEI